MPSLNTLPLVVTFSKNYYCNKFLSGYFNYSECEWIIKEKEGRIIKVIETRNPKTCSLNTLKILSLFTVIIPLIAAIYHLVKVCRFRNYRIKIISPYQEINQNQVNPEKEPPPKPPQEVVKVESPQPKVKPLAPKMRYRLLSQDVRNFFKTKNLLTKTEN